MAALREILANLLGFGQASPEPPIYIWVKESPQALYKRLKRQRSGLYETDDHKGYIQLIRSRVLEEMHKAGKQKTFMDGVGYYFTDRVDDDPNGKDPSVRYLPDGELLKQRALLRQIDTIGHVPGDQKTPPTKKLLQNE